jgi:putative MATE family efflux protein
VESVKIGLYITILALFTNVGLNYVLIFGKLGLPAMGVRGAALATLISRIVEAAVMTVYVCRVDNKLEFRIPDYFRKGDGLFGDLVRCGAPIMGAWIVWAINNLAHTAIMGRVGTEAVSAMSIANNFSQLLFMAVLGLSAALGIITSKTVGAGEYEKMKEYAITAQIIFALIGVVMGTLLLLLRNVVISAYNLTEETRIITEQFMIVLAVAQVGRCYQATCLAGLVKAGGDTSFVFKNDTIFVFGVLLPSALIAMLVFHAPAWVIYACLQSDQILKCFVAIVKINRFRWMKNLTRAA